ncbi:MAG: threonine/serine exporter family protein [Capnocytophaga sp.]|nr:threonine/serine exporter family protein [Capnocytophaga sp.]
MKTKTAIAEANLAEMTGLLAEVAVVLISNGATTTRTVRNLTRIAEAFGFKVEEFVSHSALVLTVEKQQTGEKRTLVKRIGHYHVNYSILSEVSILTWEIAGHKVAFGDIRAELEDIKQMNSYPEWVKFLFIGLATGALAMIFDGTKIEFLVAFAAAFIGIYARKLVLKLKYNNYISWFVGAFVSASVVNFCRLVGLDDHHGALTACVLWLIPGVPLMNGFLDILSGHIVSGWARVAMGVMLVFMIGVGFYLSIYVFGYGITV